ncbi:hypothetical protein L7F22_010085 [Adiantum nelumboides]|nr:hypothetical protein [Adiantum nelumboides]
MGDFIERFFSNALETDMLYDDTFVETFVAWISAMSSSNFRSFRHTAVYVALQSISQLSRIRQDVDAELQSSIKSRDIEKKKTRIDKTRLKELESKVKAMTEAKKSLKEFHGELINT